MDDFNEFQEFNQQQPAPVRPQLLTVLCVLSFIWIGLTTFGALVITPLSDIMVQILKTNPQFDPERDVDVITVFQAGWKYYLPVILLNILELTGVIMMWKLKKNGFHFYTIANILLFFLPIVMLGIQFNLFSAFIPALFVAMYSLNMRFMN
ncbi:MAG: hypothetical protein JWP12_1154 [Bacteroidetes bacterium]|nr:hypothetical protein [Bacteroidota bacterium]